MNERNANPDPEVLEYPQEVPAPLDVMKTSDVAVLLRTDERTVAALIETEALPARWIGKGWRFSRAHVIAWLGCEGRDSRKRSA